MKIIVGFSTPKGLKLGAFLIRLWTKSKYSHVYIRFESSNKKIPLNVYHAAKGMVHFREYEKFKHDNNIIKEYEIPITAEDRVDLLVNSMKLSGEVYGYFELLTIFLMDILNYFNIKVKTYDGKGYICSELIGFLMIKILKVCFTKPTYLLKPLDIELKIKEYLGV